MQKSKVKHSEEEFKLLLTGLLNNLFQANQHFKLYQNLRGALQDYEREINQCRAFWNLTFGAHREACLINLCRVYDGNSKGLSLAGLIRVIQDHPELFELPRFRERIKENPYADALVKTQGSLNQKELAEELATVSNDDPTVKKLTILRNNSIAHTNKDWLLKGKDDPNPLTWDEVKELIERGFFIYNKYRALFEASTHSSSLIGENDYKEVLKFYKLGTKFLEFMREAEQDLYS